jgi:hypothetical protein
MAVVMARRVNPRGIARPASQRRSVRSEQQSRPAASSRVSPLRRLHPAISFLKCAVLAAREPVLSGVGVDCVRLRFTPILCQPVLAGAHQFAAPNLSPRRSLRGALARKVGRKFCANGGCHFVTAFYELGKSERMREVLNVAMSLFRQLSGLSSSERFQIEDFHTEIVAHVLRNSPALTLAWLQDIGATTLQSAEHILVDTQERFAKLATHTSGSRLDLTIRLVTNEISELIFIESKVPSKQGIDQLQKYAEQLEAAHREHPLTRTSLVFITRAYEAAEKPTLSDPAFKLSFHCTRWFIFYRHLKAHLNGDGLAKELKLFMEENRMSLGNKFRSTDLVALENFFSAKALMDETIEGEVSGELTKFPGGLYSVKKCITYFRDHHLYAASNGNWNDIECYVGYWLPHENPDEPVWVGLTIYSNPTSPSRKHIVSAFRDWSGDTSRGWLSEEIEDVRAKCSIYKGKPLQELLGTPDHVRAIKDYLLALLKEMDGFHRKYPKVPWSTSPTIQERQNE